MIPKYFKSKMIKALLTKQIYIKKIIIKNKNWGIFTWDFFSPIESKRETARWCLQFALDLKNACFSTQMYNLVFLCFFVLNNILRKPMQI